MVRDAPAGGERDHEAVDGMERRGEQPDATIEQRGANQTRSDRIAAVASVMDGSRIATASTPNARMLAAIAHSASGGLCSQTWFCVQSAKS